MSGHQWYPVDTGAATVRYHVDRAAEAGKSRTFLLSPETRDEVSFAELQRNARGISHALRGLGIAQGAKVSFMLDNGLWTAQLFLGAMYGGFVVVPLDVAAGKAQLQYVLDQSDTEVVFAGEQYMQPLRDAVDGLSRRLKIIPAHPDGIVAPGDVQPGGEPLPPVAEDDDALLVYTSGSTGRPRGVVVSHKSLVINGLNTARSHLLTTLDRSLCVLPLYHMNAEVVTLMSTLLSGGSVVVPRRFAAARFWEWVREYRCTWFALVPTIVAQLLSRADSARGFARGSMPHVRFARSSSAPLPVSQISAFEETFGIVMIEAMGITEAGGAVFSNPLSPQERKPGSLGIPWGFDAKVVDREGREVEPGCTGEIMVRGECMMKGYYKDADATANAIGPDGWLRTGDLGYRDSDGYFFITGRAKEMILKGGESIAPREIDEALVRHPAVMEAAAVGVEDPFLGEDIVAFVVLRAGRDCSEQELAAFCQAELGPVKAPSRIHFVDELPKGPSGKVQRLKLRETALTRSAPPVTPHVTEPVDHATREYAQPQTLVEKALAEIWSDLLGVSRFSIHDNFFDLGGYSLLAGRILARVSERFSVSLPLRAFFEQPSVAAQAVLIVQAMLEKSPDEEVLALLGEAEQMPPHHEGPIPTDGPDACRHPPEEGNAE